MATRQSLKGISNKVYDVIGNFNKGINRRSADDVSVDSSFRELTNFYNEKEGVLSKRPGLYDSKFGIFMNYLYNNFENAFGEDTSEFYGELSEAKSRFRLFKSICIDGATVTIPTYPFNIDDPLLHDTSGDPLLVDFEPKNIVAFQVVKETNFNKFLEKFDPLNPNSCFNGDDALSFAELNVNIICSGDTPLPDYYYHISGLYEQSGLYIYKMHLKIEKWGSTTGHLRIANDSVFSLHNMKYVEEDFWKKYTLRWLYGEFGKKCPQLEMVSYNGASYGATGKDYIIKILDEFPTTRIKKAGLYTNEYDIITEIGGILSTTKYNNIYKPTPVEVSNIGFNILASDPIGYIENTGTTDAIKGVFYSVNYNDSSGTYVGKEPISDIPANSSFNLHILQTGTGTLARPQYRPDNGDTNTTTNPYKDLNGAFSSSSPHIFECTGLNGDGKYEIKTTKGSVTFLSYVSTGMNYNKEVGKVSDIKELIYKSTHLKVINNQLVLYGNHPYIFFSEYDNFYYFPNYFNLYVAKDVGEQEVVSINYFRQYYAVFTKTKIRRMTGSFGGADFGIYPLNDFVGCSNKQTIKQVNNNLLFVANDGLYKLKQGYTGEGTENVEKIDLDYGEGINTNTIKQAFVLNNSYIMLFSKKDKFIVYDFEKNTFYDFVIDGSTVRVYNNPDNNANYDASLLEDTKSLDICFETFISDNRGPYVYIPDYEYMFERKEYYTWVGVIGGSEREPTGVFYIHPKRQGMTLRMFRLSDLSFLIDEERKKDANGYISELETPNINMGTPTNTKKFKEVYVKMINQNNSPIPLYFTIYVDDIAYVSPEDYEVRYNATTNTYYYVYTTESNITLEEGAEILEGQELLGTLTLGEDTIGNKTIYQLKIKVNGKGRSIKIKLADGYDDKSEIIYHDEEHYLIAYGKVRNNKNFTITSIGIAYKLKKVKEG